MPHVRADAFLADQPCIPPPAFNFRNAQHRFRRSAGPHEPRGSQALVTGGSRRIGRSIALGLARAGADVAIGYRVDAQAARRTMASIERLGRRSFAVRADLTLGAECRRIVETAVRKLGRIDILINNVGEWVVESVATMDAGTW
ncbi:MAG: SDR family NAD(P)-dependent oxidoreductase [Methanobacteriota archaeon]|nr:MAG: SDR family NAD(P)-dependent oxidoreductase [Euryarchaeota archaeon]